MTINNSTSKEHDEVVYLTNVVRTILVPEFSKEDWDNWQVNNIRDRLGEVDKNKLSILAGHYSKIRKEILDKIMIDEQQKVVMDWLIKGSVCPCDKLEALLGANDLFEFSPDGELLLFDEDDAYSFSQSELAELVSVK